MAFFQIGSLSVLLSRFVAFSGQGYPFRPQFKVFHYFYNKVICVVMQLHLF